MTSAEKKNLNILQILFESIVILGYVIAIIPAWYFFTFWFVIPLTVVNLYLGIRTKNQTLAFAAGNIGMSLVTFIPIIGYLAICGGIAFSVLNMTEISKSLNLNPQKYEIKEKEKIIDVESKEKPQNTNPIEK